MPESDYYWIESSDGRRVVVYTEKVAEALILGYRNPTPIPSAEELTTLSTPSELRAHALKLKDHAWLERFRLANYENRYNELSPFACNEIARYVNEFIEAVLAATPRDSDVPIDEAWLRSVCTGGKAIYHTEGNDGFRDYGFGERGETVVVEVRIYDEAAMPLDLWIDDQGIAFWQPKTRGDLRDLCRVLGITLTSETAS